MSFKLRTSRTFFKAGLVGLLLLTGCTRPDKKLDFIRGQQIILADTLPEDPDILDIIQPYKDSVDAYVHTPLCYNPRLLSRRESPLETSLGNLLADIALRVGDTLFTNRNGQAPDMALLNYGGMRIDLVKGEVTVEDIFQLMPFENRLVLLELSPEKTQELLDYLVFQRTAHPISGLRLIVDGDSLVKATIGGEPIDPNRSYRVVTSDYLSNGGDYMDFLTRPLKKFTSDMKLRDAFIERFAREDTLGASLDGRFTQYDPSP